MAILPPAAERQQTAADWLLTRAEQRPAAAARRYSHPCPAVGACSLFLFCCVWHISAYQSPEVSIVMKRSFAVMATSFAFGVVPARKFVAATCLYFEAMPCAEVTQIRGDCQLEDLASNDALEEYGCCVDPMPKSCDCFVGGLRLADIDNECNVLPPCSDGDSGSIKCKTQATENESVVANPMAEVQSSSTRATSIVKESSAAATLLGPKSFMCMTTVAGMSLAQFLLLP